MNFSFENQGINTYLVYTIDKADEVDSMSLGMLTNNKIPGLAPAIFQQMDKTKYIKYNISAKVSVKQFFAGAVNRKRLLGVFSGIVNAMMSAEEYMIDAGSILLDLDYIYTDVSTCDTVLICIPVVTGKEPVDLGTFFKNIVFGTQFDQTENCDYVARIINYLNSMPVFSLLDFKEILDELNRGTLSQKQQIPVSEPKVQSSAVQPVQTQQPAASLGQPQSTVQVHNVQQASLKEMPQGLISQSTNSQSTVPPQSVLPNAEQKPLGEKQMSAMYLMMHYSKENKQKYRAQKEQKKIQQSAAQKTDSNGKMKKEKKQKGKTSQQSFAISNTNGQVQGFAIPGQPIPNPGQEKFPASPVINDNRAGSPNQVSQGISQNTPNLEPQTNSVFQNVQITSQPQVITGNANFGETTVLGGGNIGETTVLSTMQQTGYNPKPYLIRMKNNEKIPLDKPVFRIGKEKSYVDYFIGDNTAISRSHANIITREGEYYVVDTNSTNHTYVNETMIQSNAETRISGGTKIRLANEEFEFKML